MDKTNETVTREDGREETIELGIASIETKGPLIPPVEGMGAQPIGISAE